MTNYVYGPVKSRRLGRSLGVDILPMKTCNYDCIYCQIGSGYSTIFERKVYIPAALILQEIDKKLNSTQLPDYITLGGSGEPTLNTAFGDIATKLKNNYDIPVCLLTNGSLMWMPEVREECHNIDVIIPNLDACDDDSFSRINRPHPSIDFNLMLNGLIELRKNFNGSLWLEIFLIPGINDSDIHCAKFKEMIQLIAPDKVQLNTAVRPPAEKEVQPLSPSRLMQIRDLINNEAEIIAKAPEMALSAQSPSCDSTGEENKLLNVLKRRPCTAEELAAITGMPVKKLEPILKKLIADGSITRSKPYYGISSIE